MADEKKDGSDFELIDREDEQQILDDLRGVVVDKLVYKNKRGEFELSYAGTKWAVREMAKRGEAIRVDGHPKVERCPLDPEYIVVTVLAKRVIVDKDTSREITLDSAVGSSRGWTKQKLTDGRIIPDEHFFTKTVSKATRNVQQALMPIELKKEMVKILAKGPPKPAAAEEKKSEPKPAPKPEPAPAPKPEEKKPEPKPEPKPEAKGDDAGAARQHLMAAFKIAIGDDVPKIRRLLKSWTGKEKTHDLDVKTMARLTSALRGIKNGEVKYSESSVVDLISGEVLFGKASEAAPKEGSPEDPNYF